MSSLRVAFANSTNSPRSSSRPASNRLISKLSSRKSAPTCTISLASVSANDSCINLASIPFPSSSTPATNLVPFPSTPLDCLDAAISQPDRTCLRLLRSSPETPSQPRTRATTALHGRKRSTARLLQPATTMAPEQCSSAEPSCQRPRKRPRLQGSAKTIKRTSPINSSDLRFQAIVQRSVAGGVLERGAAAQSKVVPSSQSTSLETQDVLLASRLRSRLLAQGLREADLINLDSQPHEASMDVDAEQHPSSIASADMDIDVEIPMGRASPAPRSILSSPPRPSVLLDLDCTLGTEQLVAALILRHQARKPSRSTAGLREKGMPMEILRRPSPLATSTF
ncbi:hypothetical protein FPV67DRAFT_1510657 [Lyophyllum atratum]|nr:hypothetical protein FPV67DRAFT_1510657 [Lyophyllum atratum]